MFTCGPLAQNRYKENTENQHKPLRELGCRLIIHECSQLRSRYKYARRMRTVYHAGTLRRLTATYISTKSAISAQVVSWFDKLQPFKPPAAPRWLVVHLISLRTLYMARTHGVELTTPRIGHWRQGSSFPPHLSVGMRFLSSLGRPASLLRNCGSKKSSFTANCPTSSQDD